MTPQDLTAERVDRANLRESEIAAHLAPGAGSLGERVDALAQAALQFSRCFLGERDCPETSRSQRLCLGVGSNGDTKARRGRGHHVPRMEKLDAELDQAVRLSGPGTGLD